ncbi:MAG TPA: hypothetical protein VGO63_04155 [Candidatus Paceibacterota bacterium]|jgi:hypothetical protein|nr:hypothetical protein [Candidatus Paceibacterota bacterium]
MRRWLYVLYLNEREENPTLKFSTQNTSLCPECNKKIETGEDGKFVTHRKWIPRSEQENEEGGHCRNIVDRECPGSGVIAK